MFSIQPEQLWRRYIVAIVLIAMTITGSHVIATRSSGDSALVAADVNLSGRQRMLSQRITLFARSLVHQSDVQKQKEYLSILQSDLELFSDSHKTLRSRAYLNTALLNLYQGTGERSGLDDMVLRFGILGRQTIEAWDQNDTKLQTELLDRLPTLSTGPLLFELNQAVLEFETIATEIESKEKQISDLIFAAALILLGLEATLIFWPAHRAIISSIADLKHQRRVANTQRRVAQDAAKQAENALRTKTEFFNMLSHELRTPLNGIVAGTEILKEAQIDKDDREIVDVIAKAGETLTQKITFLLEMSSSVSDDEPLRGDENFREKTSEIQQEFASIDGD